MIDGTVNENYEATILLILRGVAREEREIEAIIDTGFTGYLTLPTALIDRLALSWKGRSQALIADGSVHVFDEYIWNSVVERAGPHGGSSCGRYYSPRRNGIAQEAQPKSGRSGERLGED